MRIFYITAGAGRMECDACLRDASLARALIARGHDVLFVPTYTPIQTDTGKLRVSDLFYGGVNVYLQQKYPFFRRTPRFFDRFFDSSWLLNFVSRFGHMTEARDLAELTISMLEGEHGHLRKELERLLEWLATQPRPDIVVLPNSMFAGSAGPLRERLGAPILCLLSGEDAFIEQFPEPYHSRTLKVLRGRAADIDSFLAPNRYYADFMTDYLKLPPERVHVAPVGIDSRPFAVQPYRPPEVFTIGYRSTICPANGLHLLVEALRLLKADPATAHCRLRAAGYLEAGERGYFQQIEENVRRWGLAESFEYVGEIDPAERVRFLGGLSVFSVPSAYPEPVGMFVPEALAAGVPVVVPRVGCLPEWLGATGGGLLVESPSPAALAAALGRLMREPALARQLGESGRQAVLGQYTTEQMAGAALEVFGQYLPAAPSRTMDAPPGK